MTAQFPNLEPDRPQDPEAGLHAARTALPSMVRDLGVLVQQGVKFPTIYADPPWPYLELYGREEQPNSGWTVYGNQVERRLF